jgi:hypothetical protein
MKLEIIENWTEQIIDITKDDQETTLAFGDDCQFLKINKGGYYIRKLQDDEDLSKIVKGG